MTNEGGLDGTYRLLKNIMGLWLVQQCKRAFEARGEQHDYAQLARMAAKAPPLRSLVNLNDPRFLNPPDMPKAIQDFCRETKQPVPRTEGELVRCCYESLALKYREVLVSLEELTGEPHRCDPHRGRWFAKQGLEPVCGGCLSAARGDGSGGSHGAWAICSPRFAPAASYRSLAEMREVVRASSAVQRYEPAAWEGAADRFASLRKKD